MSSCNGISKVWKQWQYYEQYERRWIKWFAIPIVSIFIRDYHLQYTSFLSLSSKESEVLSSVITVHLLRRKVEIKTVSALTRLPSSLVLWHSLKWRNGWGRETIFDIDCCDGCMLKRGGKKLLRYREREY